MIENCGITRRTAARASASVAPPIVSTSAAVSAASASDRQPVARINRSDWVARRSRSALLALGLAVKTEFPIRRQGRPCCHIRRCHAGGCRLAGQTCRLEALPDLR